MSIRLKTILGVALIEAVLLTILIYSMLSFLRDTSEKQLKDYADLTRANFVTMSKDAVLGMDLARLESLVLELKKAQGIMYARVLDADDVLLAQAGPVAISSSMRKPDADLANVHDGIFDLVGDVEVAGTRFGRIEVGIDVAYLKDLTEKARWWSLGVAGIEMGLVALFSFLLGTYLTRQLRKLSDAAERIGRGELGYQVPVEGKDEVAETVRVFNQMSSELLNDRAVQENLMAELKSVLHRLDTVQSLSPDGYIHFNAERRVTAVNSAYETMTGRKRDDLIGQSLEDEIECLRRLAASEYRFPLTEQYLEEVSAALVKDEVQPGPGAHLYLWSPQLRVLDCHFGINKNDGSSVLYLHDVTQLTEVERMKSEFMVTAAHELRSPMTIIVGFTELLLNQSFDTPTSHDILQTVHRQGLTMSGMVNQLLDLSRMEARTAKLFEFSPQQVEHLVRECVNEAFVGFANHTMKLSISTDLPLINVDGAKVHQALLNVLSNAFKYSPQGGEVDVQVFHVAHASGHGQVCLSVSDPGIGMTPEQTERVFERFYRADASGHILGTGLGMAITKEIMDIHGGNIEIDSIPGQGTKVALCFAALAKSVSQESETLAK